MRQATIKTLAACLALGAMLGAAPAKDANKSDADESATPDPRIGPEVDRICFQNSINNWRSLRGEDDVVLLRSGVRRWHRVELIGGCNENVFGFAQAIGIESRPTGGCVTRGDVIIVKDSPGFTHRCHITHIYEWNEDALEENEETEEAPDEGV